MSSDSAAGRADSLDYGQRYTMRTNFTHRSRVDPIDAIAASVPKALSGENGADLPPGSLGNGDAALALAAHVESGCDQEL